jgi:hypothetical protein
MSTSETISQRSSALVAGISLLLMAVVAGVTYGYLHGNLMVTHNAQATFQNLQNSPGAFQAEIAGWLVILILDGIVAWALYHFFAKANIGVSFFSSFLRIIYTVILGIAIYHLPQIIFVLANPLQGTALEQSATEAMNFLLSFENIWSKGLIVFGFHLMTMGYLAFTSGYVPKIWGVLLVIAGVSYSYIHAMHTFFPTMIDYLSTVEAILSLPMMVGDVGFAIWLVAKGGKSNSAKAL